MFSLLFCPRNTPGQFFIVFSPDFLSSLPDYFLYPGPGKPPVFIMYLVDDFFYLVGHVNPPFCVVFLRPTSTRVPGLGILDDASFRNMFSGNIFSVLASCSPLACKSSLVSW